MNRDAVAAESDDESTAELVRSILDSVPVSLLEGPSGNDLRQMAGELAAGLLSADRNFASNGAYLDADLRRINDAADRISALDRDFTLSDIDRDCTTRTAALRFNTHNMLFRLSGRADHESHWDGTTWTNWNQLVRCVPESFHSPRPSSDSIDDAAVFAPIQQVVRNAATLRVVAGGHAFNESASTGGTLRSPHGTLLCLDEYKSWRRLNDRESAGFRLTQGSADSSFVRVQAGIRLRDFNAAMWSEGLALPLCGSTDTQSLGGLIASDLHGTGRRNGFLAEQIAEVRTVCADGRLITWTRTSDGFVTDETPSRRFSRLPVAGALGLLGVVVDLVIELIPAYYLEKRTYFADRWEVESDLESLVDQHDHVNLFYPGGGPSVRTIQVNTLDRTSKRPSPFSLVKRLAGEMGDHALSSYAPATLFGLASKDVHTDPFLRLQNMAGSNVMPAPVAFSRRLYYLHDEVEYAFPFDVAIPAIRTTVNLLQEEELHSILEIRFTPDCAKSMIGPGNCAAGRGRAIWFGLATAIGEHSRSRILQFFEKFDRVMQPFGGRPHLGKQTARTGMELAQLLGKDWTDFQLLRRELDPSGKFLPASNLFLQKIFG